MITSKQIQAVLAIGAAVLLGGGLDSALHGQPPEILMILAGLLLDRIWAVVIVLMASAVAIVAGGYTIKFFLNKIQIQKQTELTAEAFQQIEAQVIKLHDKKFRELDALHRQIEERLTNIRKTFNTVLLSRQELQQEQLAFVSFVQGVASVLEKRSERLRDEMPENPVKVKGLLERDAKLHGHLQSVLVGMRADFPAIAAGIPDLKMLVIPDVSVGLVPVDRDGNEITTAGQAEDNKGRVAEFKGKRLIRSGAVRPRQAKIMD
jgi:hypothetical protein